MASTKLPYGCSLDGGKWKRSVEVGLAWEGSKRGLPFGQGKWATNIT